MSFNEYFKEVESLGDLKSFSDRIPPEIINRIGDAVASLQRAISDLEFASYKTDNEELTVMIEKLTQKVASDRGALKNLEDMIVSRNQ